MICISPFHVFNDYSPFCFLKCSFLTLESYDMFYLHLFRSCLLTKSVLKTILNTSPTPFFLSLFCLSTSLSDKTSLSFILSKFMNRRIQPLVFYIVFTFLGLYRTINLYTSIYGLVCGISHPSPLVPTLVSDTKKK